MWVEKIDLSAVAGTWFLAGLDGRLISWSTDLPTVVGRALQRRGPRATSARELLAPADGELEALRSAARGSPVPPHEVVVSTAAGPARYHCAVTVVNGGRPVVLCQLFPLRNGVSRERRAAPPLTPRQHQILRLLVNGSSTEEVSDELGLRTHTVRNHVRALLRRLGVHSRVEAVVLAVRRGLV